MQRSGGGGMGTRTAMGGARRSHTCTECGKSFRSGEDLFMHAEVCLLDAFEIEASAMQSAVVGTGAIRQPQGQSGSPVKRSMPAEQAYGATAGDRKRDVGAIMTPRQPADVVAKRASATGGSEGAVQIAADDSVEPDQFDEDDGDDDSEEFDPPPELELAEPPQKKYKRTFPIGDDGKQIRPKMECPTCGLVLYRHNFSTHFRIHTGELPFQCSFCDKRFRTSSALTVHTRCHTGERPYECPHCNYCCITKRNLDRHIVNNHVKKSSRGAVRLSREYYAPRTRRVVQPYGVASSGLLGNLDYDDDLDDDTLEDDIDDENLDEAELEEEAGISRMTDQFPKHPTQVGESDAQVVSTAPASGDEGRVGETGGQSASGQASYARLGAVKTVPILDGPKGVYGDPEAEREETSKQPEATANTETAAEGEKEMENQGGGKEPQQQEEASS